MMVSTVLTNVTNQLSNFDFISKFTLEATVENLSLTRFQTIAKTWNGTLAVS